MRRIKTRPLDIDYTQHDFQFTKGWFVSRNRTTFIEHVMPKFQGQPCIYVEVGVYESASLVWMFQNVLTHPDSSAVGIDPWLPNHKLSEEMSDAIRARAYHNIQPFADRCTLVRMTSADALRTMIRRDGRWGICKENVDLCMIDGHHSDLGALDDGRHVFELVKVGGWILFDDIEKQHPRLAYTGMLQWEREFAPHVKRIWNGKFLQAFEKVSQPEIPVEETP